MLWDEHIAAVVAALSDCRPPLLVAFAASVAERQLPNYRAFMVDVEWGNADELEATLEIVWRQLLLDTFNHAELRDAPGRLIGLSPDADDFASPYVTFAQDAVAAVEASLQLILAPSTEILREVIGIGLASNSGFVDKTSASLLPELFDTARLHWVYESPLVVAERAKQRSDAELLRDSPEITNDVLRRLRENNDVLGIQPLRRGMLRSSGEPGLRPEEWRRRGEYREVSFQRPVIGRDQEVP